MYAKRNRDGLFHHSSFFRGQEVICAGSLWSQTASCSTSTTPAATTARHAPTCTTPSSCCTTTTWI
jgi:hypothetical protein